MTQDTEQTQNAVAVRSGEGEARWWFGMLAEIKATSADTGGQFTIVEVTCAPGYQGVRHIHHNEEESMFLIEGRLMVGLGDETFEVSRGDMVNLPKGRAHGFRAVGDSPAQVLFTIDLMPTSDYETMFSALVGVEATDFDHIRTVTAANGVEFLNPPALP